MLRAIPALALVALLAACGGVSLNPFTWFGGEREERITVVETEEETDPRPLVAEVTSLTVESTTSGAIVRATAVNERAGYWQPSLVEIERTEDSITYAFRAAAPWAGSSASAAPAREIVVATTLGRRDAATVRSITVIGRENRRTVSRR